jgi:hypothetical protein
MTAADIARCVARHFHQAPPPIAWEYDDGGRRAAGFTRMAPGDCAARALAIAAQLPYRDACARVDAAAARERPRRGNTRSDSASGVYSRTFRRLMDDLGWIWTPTMDIGTGCRVHLRRAELPSGRLIVSLSRHYAAVIDGVVRDYADPSRDGTRCVYGYWQPPHEERTN